MSKKKQSTDAFMKQASLKAILKGIFDTYGAKAVAEATGRGLTTPYPWARTGMLPDQMMLPTWAPTRDHAVDALVAMTKGAISIDDILNPNPEVDYYAKIKAHSKRRPNTD